MYIGIVTIKASKATPKKAISYITSPLKAAKVKSINLDPNRDFNEQMRETAKLWNKAQTHDTRKYMHLKLSFPPDDSRLNKLTEDGAMDIGTTLVREFFPSFESVLSVHVDKEHLHVHAIINAVDPLSGKMLNMRSAQYRALKDRVQESCSQRGLSSIDWRAATKAKREKERTDGPVIRESFAEQRMHQEGKISIKTKLRSIIDQAVKSATSFEEFQENLKQQDVMLTRSTSNTISYKLSTFRSYRGDSLGSNFTMLAIRNRLDYNQKKIGIDGKIKAAELRANGKHVLKAKETDLLYDFGRMIGLSREEVGQLVDHALYASREGKKQAWDLWRANKDRFWESYRQSQAEIANHLDDLYRQRKLLKQSEWILNPYNTKTSLWGILFAFVLRLSSHASLDEIEEEIAYYKLVKARLRENIEQFKKAAEKGIQNLNKADFDLDDYLKAIAQMHTSADNAMLALLDIPPERRWILTSDYQMVRESDLLENQRLEER